MTSGIFSAIIITAAVVSILANFLKVREFGSSRLTRLIKTPTYD
jgi:hypothetical protein